MSAEITMNARGRDPFALGGAQDDDAILSLFRRWIAGHRAAEKISTAIEAEDEFGAAISRIVDIEHEIADTPASGSVGFAVKAYLACHHEHQPRRGDDPAGVSLLSRGYAITSGEPLDGFSNLHCIAAVVRDAARFVPEIAELAGPVIAPEPAAIAEEAARFRAAIMAMPAQSSAASADLLIELGAEWDAISTQLAGPEGTDALCDTSVVVEDRIAELVPRSAAGVAIQVRLLRHWQRDFEWGEPAEELVGKILAGLERLSEAGGP